MISSISLRLPQKTCGLFDTGFAGGDDVTSWDAGVLTAVDQSLYSFEDLQPFNPQDSGAFEAQQKPLGIATEKHEAPIMSDMDWPADMLDPLGGLEDPLGNDSLDAFVNLDTLLMGDAFLDDCNLTAVDSASELVEVKPVIDFLPEPATKPRKATGKPNSRKRKAASTQATKTTVFEIPDSTADHDYSSKHQKMSPPEEVESAHIATSSGTCTSEAPTEDRQAVRRMKNNVASKRSREQRKAKFVEMDKEADYLTEENDRLRKKIVELEQTAKEMKALLVAKMAGKA